MAKLKPYPYRAFICYASEDLALAEMVRDALTEVGIVGWLDKRRIKGGSDFTTEIREAILSAHLFVPILTEKAHSRPWVHQEIGFAHALNVPVLPIAVGLDPAGLIRHLQAVSVSASPRLTELVRQLDALDLSAILEPAAKARRMLVEIAASAIDRPRLMVQYAERTLRALGGGMVRQKAYYTSFSLPDKPTHDPIWSRRELGQERMADYLEEQRRERQVMEKLARLGKCRLIVDPRPQLFSGDSTGWRARIGVLYDFLDSMPDSLAQAMPANMKEPHNVVLVGDRFLAEADSRVAGQGYQRTHFTWHAPTVLWRIREFDEEFADHCESVGSNGIRPEESRRYTLDVLRNLLSAQPDRQP